MSTKNHNSKPTDLSSVLEMLTDFQAGNFSKKLPQNDDSNLKPLIDKMNETAKFFEAQAAQTEIDITERKQAEEVLRQSKAQLREIEQIYTYSPIGLFILDREYRFQRINERMAEINGFSVAHHLGKTLDEIAPDLAGFLKEAYRPIFERGEPVLNVEIHGKTPKDPDHEKDWIGNYFPLKSETGEVIGLIGTVLEITERKQAEIELARSTQLLEQSQSMAKLGGWELDLLTGVLYWTAETYRIHDTSPEEFNPTVDAGVGYFLPESKRQISEALELAMTKGIGYDLYLETYTTKARKIDIRTTCEVTVVDGKPTKLTGIFQDITEQKILEQEKEGILKRLNYALDASGDGIWDWTPADGKTVYSKAWIEMLGYKVGELASLASEWSDRLHPDDVEQVFAAINKVTQTPENGDTLSHEYRFRNKAGDYLWILNKVKVVERNEKGEASRVVGTHTNITELVAAKEENRLILDTVGFGVWKFNPVTQDLVWDKSMYNLFGISPEEFNGHYQAWESSLTPQAKAEAVKELDLALKGEKEFNHTFAINYKDTEKRYIGGKGQVIRNKDGSPAMMYGVNWDRTKEVELQKNLEEEKIRSFHNSKLAAIGHLSAGVGHEINNPLAIISGQILIVGDILKGSENVPAEVIERLNKMENAVSRIGNIVKTLRTFARSDETLTDFDPFELVFESVNMLKDLYLKDEVALTLAGNPKASFIHGDRGRVQQVLVNLISNAKDATAGVPNRKIDVTVSYEEGHIKLAITDNGCGIPDEIKEKIFEPFFTTKEINRGTGIGLSLVSSIIKEHEGKLELNSKIGVGSTFTIFFPVTFGHSVMVVDAQNGSRAAIQEKIHCNVLIVDDEEDLRGIFQFILSRICSNVVVAESAQAGYDIVAQGKTDIVLSDIRMPSQDGFDLLRMIRQNKKITQPKFVFLTGGVQLSEEELQIIQFQTDGFFTKPLGREDVSKKIRELFPERVS